jgi:hypothetical protein
VEVDPLDLVASLKIYHQQQIAMNQHQEHGRNTKTPPRALRAPFLETEDCAAVGPYLVGNSNKTLSASVGISGDITGILSSFTGAFVVFQASFDNVSGTLYKTPSTPSIASTPFSILFAKDSTWPCVE